MHSNPVPQVKLSKSYSREHALLYGFIWYESDFRYVKELWGSNVEKFLVIKEANTRKLHFWYDSKELDAIYKWVQEQLRTSPAYFRLVKKRFNQHLLPLLPYLAGKKKIKTMPEFKQYYFNWLHWWSPMDSFYFIPDFENVPAGIRKEALAVREKTQHVTEEIEKPFLDFLAEKYPSYARLADALLPSEVFALEKRGLTANEIAAIEKRRDGCAIFRGEVFLLPELKKVLEKNNLFLEETNIQKTDELKGLSAYPGVVTGKARLVLFKEDIHKVLAGEILVTEMTSPDFVFAIKKAAAIVTNEGGITCHAAIASREFKKPGVVGTKNATQTIKNGDLIQVDANAGTVRIIQSQ